MRNWMKVVLISSVVISTVQIRSQQPSADDFFTTNVRPIFESRCYACHSGSTPRGDLNLDVKSLALKGGASGTAILPGNSKESRLMHRVTGADAGSQMPLAGKPLTPEQISTLARWIDEGAKWPDTVASARPVKKHWSYLKPEKPALPAVQDAKWSRNGLDRFILARLEKEGLKPSPEATKETLIRRLSLDLIGLPPTPAEVDAFLADTRADAYERLVDRLLASPRYGERWATPWLDLARYGDSDGWRNDRQRVAWPYRDWVIKALNQNMPFNQFTIEQLAGDLLPNATKEQKIATGFIRSSTLLVEGGTDPEENNFNAQLDRASTVGTTWLGATIGCAQCHNHKFDPYTQKNFYQMVAFFNNVAFTNESPDPTRRPVSPTGKNYFEPKLDLPTAEQARQLENIRAEIKKLEEQLNDNSPSFQSRQAQWEQRVLTAEKDWQPLQPTRMSAANGTVLTAAADNYILATGKNPDTETYVLEFKAPAGEITGLRIEAAPDASLPAGGPGRDFYGNFLVNNVTVESGSAQQLAKTGLKDILRDEAMPFQNDLGGKIRQIWIVDASHLGKTPTIDGRVRVQLLLVPEKPIKAAGDGMLRITVAQRSEINGGNLGHFRVSATMAATPQTAVDVPASLRFLLSVPVDQRTPEQSKQLTAHYRTVDTELVPVRQNIAEMREKIEALKIPAALIVEEDMTVPHPSMNVRVRGAFTSKGDLVEADVPSFLGELPKDAPPNRLGLAKWLVSRDNPLTARVTVNRYWQSIFGRGIVETAEDFGTQGFAPTHPELMDWLATEFMDNGWNVKALQRMIVTSSTYRQSSAVTSQLQERDPANMLFARAPRFRVEAEMVRDNALAASGLLSAKMFGAPVMPYQPDGLWGLFPNSRASEHDEWVVSPGEDRYRRGIYTFVRRSVRYPSLTVFDAPSREFCTARRSPSNTPLQALAVLNDPAFFEAAQAMARRILKEGGSTQSSRASYGFRLATARKPAPQEIDAILTSFQSSVQHFQGNLKEAEAVSGKPDAELAAWTMFSNAILNLDETLTKE